MHLNMELVTVVVFILPQTHMSDLQAQNDQHKQQVTRW